MHSQQNIKKFETLGVESELVLSNNTNKSLKYQVSEIIKKEFLLTSNYNTDTDTLKSIKSKINENNVTFTRADKGNTVIALNSSDYKEKTLSFLDPNNYKILKSDPTEKFNKEIKSTLVKCQSIVNPADKYKLLIMNPLVPKLYSLIKLHKDNYPIRPVVSFCTAPSVKISKMLINLIRNHCNFTPKFSIKNSYELVDKIKNVTIPPNGKLVSFDVSNLFPSIPPLDTINLVEKLLAKNNVNPIIKQDILQLLSVCLKQNYFQFDNKIYTSCKGLIMGNPLSPLLAEIFMDNIENIIYQNNNFSKQFLYWHRYVDDILVCFLGTNRQLNTVLEYINKIHPNITFTSELEINNSINFLDLTITKINNKHDFSIYHKPSHTDTTIHNKSVHPYTHKLAAYNSLVHRLLNIPLSKENYEKELNIIKQIAINNGYKPDLIDNIVDKKLHKKAINLVYPIGKTLKSNYSVLTYVGSPTDKLTQFFKKQGANITYRTNNSLGKHLKNNKDKNIKNNNSGVYQINCGSCDKVYIGQTGRNFNKRITEHKNNFLKEKTDSTYANHLLSEKHNFNEDFKILHKENKGKKLNLLESLEINKLKNTNLLLNDQLDLNGSPLLNLFN